MNRSIVASVVISLVATSSLSFAAQQTALKSPAKPLKVAALSTTATTTTPTTSAVDKKKKKKKKSQKPQAKQAAAAKPAAAPVAASNKPAAAPAPAAKTNAPTSNPPATATLAPAGNAAKTSTTIAAAKKEIKKNPWSFKYRVETAIDMNNGQKDVAPYTTGNASSLDRAYLNYSLGDTTTLSLVQWIRHNWFGKAEDLQNPKFGPYASARSQLNLDDTYLEIFNSNVAKLGGGLVYSAGIRATAPTSESSQYTGQQGIIAFNNFITKEIGKFTIDWFVSPRAYAQQNQTWESFKRDDKTGQWVHDAFNQTNRFRIINGLELNQAITSKLSIEYDTYMIQTWTHPDDADGRPAQQQDLLEMQPLINYAFNDHFGMTVGLDAYVSMRDQKRDFSAFRDDETAYYIKADFKF